MPKKRPWYLVLALVLSTSFGACGWFDGYQSVLFYRDTQVDAPAIVEQLPENAAKARVREAHGALIQERDLSRKRGFPLAVGTFLVGAAVLLFTARAFANRGTSKQFLLQFLVAQTALIIATHFALPGIRLRKADLSAAFDHAFALTRAKTDAERAQADQVSTMVKRLSGPVQTVALALRVSAALFVVIALTRRRTREFYGELDGNLGETHEVDPPNTK
ncbi:MAG: hypothetical protein U0174_10495 [Polyangiaceae bacterium]